MEKSLFADDTTVVGKRKEVEEGVRDVEGVEEGVVADTEDQQNGRKRKGNDSPTFVSSQTIRKKKA